MKIFGIDPGTATTGYACLEFSKSGASLFNHGCIRTSPSSSLQERIKHIYNEVCCLLDAFKPDVVVMERQFFNRNVTNALLVGHASGVILLAAAERDIPVKMYTPLQVKQTIAGYGKATKKQIQYMVKSLLGLKEEPSPDDAADAIALAICHAFFETFQAAVENSR